MKLSWKALWRYVLKQNHLPLKLAVSILLVGFSFRLLFSHQSNGFSDVTDTPDIEKTISPEPPVSVDSSEDRDQIPQRVKGGCIQTNPNCRKLRSIYWGLDPKPGWALPSFQLFLSHCFKLNTCIRPNEDHGKKKMENVEFYTDHVLASWSQVEPAVEVYHDAEYRSRRWHFFSYNFTISVIWSPFLAKAAIFENNDGVSTSEIELQLDKLDETWTDLYQGLDYVIFSSELGFNFAYRKVLKNVFDFIISSNHKGMVFFRTTTPDHFENGEWFSGGTCQRTTPVKEGEFELNELIKILRDVELEEFEKAAVDASRKGVNLKLLDLMQLSLLRPDGHPGPYRHFYPFAKDKNAKVINDCLHWCLPGPIDSWNDLIMEMVLSG
ncbi:TRICHOME BIREFRINGENCE-LIKE 23 [Actinidia rufa]|uniref:TRICHOME BIREFRINGENCE-LIKE 23 n=1 Tax=Actinidia rufa TaxID=165716 RepID=A0A7J0FS02_9ERIC|nr:TRICHOME BIREFRINGENCE-LIKE 23 [Actinidia rufa]